MKHLFIIAGLLLISFFANCKQVDENTAKRVGQAFLVNNTNSPVLKSTISLELAYRTLVKTGNLLTSTQSEASFYVFNTGSRGFVIVAGDDNVTPILGYSDEISFDPARIPENVAKWLEGYKKEIRYVVENHIPATSVIAEAWRRLRNGEGFSSKASEKIVAPLMQTKWDQAPFYNDLCPFDNESGERTVTGCVATAMAQIMKYWSYPVNGSGFNSYNHERYGTLSANFGTAGYQWGSMPNTLAAANADIATLMYHVGISVDMNYGTGAAGGSTAFVISSQSPGINCSEYSLKHFFGYKSTLQGIERVNYSTSQWVDLLKTEFDASRPVLYAGFGAGGGHCFVADGYDNNNFFHFNWGWGGYYDGYFTVDALNPDGQGTGGGTGSYNSGQQAVIGIEPPETSQSYDLLLYDFVTPSPNPVSYGHPFTVSLNIANQGTGTFTGDYTVAIFDQDYNFVDSIETMTNQNLQSGNAYTSDLVFSSDGLLSMLPGNYFAGVFYRPTLGNWTQIADNGDYSNMVPLSVTYTNNIELNSALVITPGTTLIQGSEISVNLNIINNGSETFTGQYGVALYDLHGDLRQTIDLFDETEGLPQGYTYLDPFLTFANSSVDVEPGTYLLAVLHQFTDGDWQLTGSTNFQNPVKVIVQAAGNQPDIYEDNNTAAEAREIPVDFINNAAHISTPGSNCHIGNDYDYYTVDLPEGYNYIISPKLQDSYVHDDGNTYTLDAIFSLSPDGEQWSDAYDDVPETDFSLDYGGKLYFLVSPYFTGETGTYLLDMNITRTPATSIPANGLSGLFRVYPNPASDVVWIDLNAFNDEVQRIELVNAAGQQVLEPVRNPVAKTVKMEVGNLPGGIYFVRLYASQGMFTKKIIIKD